MINKISVPELVILYDLRSTQALKGIYQPVQIPESGRNYVRRSSRRLILSATLIDVSSSLKV